MKLCCCIIALKLITMRLYQESWSDFSLSNFNIAYAYLHTYCDKNIHQSSLIIKSYNSEGLESWSYQALWHGFTLITPIWELISKISRIVVSNFVVLCWCLFDVRVVLLFIFGTRALYCKLLMKSVPLLSSCHVNSFLADEAQLVLCLFLCFSLTKFILLSKKKSLK